MYCLWYCSIFLHFPEIPTLFSFLKPLRRKFLHFSHFPCYLRELFHFLLQTLPIELKHLLFLVLNTNNIVLYINNIVLIIFKCKQYIVIYCHLLCNLFMHLRSGPRPRAGRGGRLTAPAGGPRGRDRAHRMAGAFCPVGIGPVATRAAGTCPAVTRHEPDTDFNAAARRLAGIPCLPAEKQFVATLHASCKQFVATLHASCTFRQDIV